VECIGAACGTRGCGCRRRTRGSDTLPKCINVWRELLPRRRIQRERCDRARSTSCDKFAYKDANRDEAVCLRTGEGKEERIPSARRDVCDTINRFLRSDHAEETARALTGYSVRDLSKQSRRDDSAYGSRCQRPATLREPGVFLARGSEARNAARAQCSHRDHRPRCRVHLLPFAIRDKEDCEDSVNHLSIDSAINK